MIKLNQRILITAGGSLGIALLIPANMFPPALNLFLGFCSLTLGAITLKEALRLGSHNDN